MNKKEKRSNEWIKMMEEFDKFQEILDNDVMTVEDLQEWCGHMNFVIKDLIVNVKCEFDKLREVDLLENNTEPDITSEFKKDYGGFYI